MLYHLLFPWSDSVGFLNVFRYITFRTAGAVVTALVLSIVLGPWFIATLRRLSIGQNIREVGPQSHLVKAGTPTMGGLLILFSLASATLLWADLTNLLIWLALGVTVLFGCIGFADDYLKVQNKRNLGLTARAKFLGQNGVAAIAAILLLSLPARYAFEPVLMVPFFKDVSVDLGWLYVPFVMLVLVAASNTVNLTDGLDGLAIGSTLVAGATYAVFTYVAGNLVVAEYLQFQHLPGAGEVTVFCGALVGSCLGFLWFNCHPAEVFMGDVGSLALGGAIGMVAVLSKQELLLVVVGGLFVLEGLSVILQVASFKLTGKRIFRMAPLHHHFELKGWTEPKIIVRFWILAVLFGLVSLSTLKLR